MTQALECWHEPESKFEAPMKMRLLFGGILIGCAIGILVGGATVKVASDGSGKREIPQGLALLMAIVGGIAVRSALREPAKRPE